MTCKSSAIKALSCLLIVFSVIIFFNWVYVFLSDGFVDLYYYEDPGYYFEGLYVWPMLVTGIVGLTTACGDTACKRIALLIIGSLAALPTIGIFAPLVIYYDDDGRSVYICDGYQYDGCYQNCHYEYLRSGMFYYSVSQMFIVVLALVTEICLVIITALHHCGVGNECCGNCDTSAQPGVINPGSPAAVPVMIQPGTNQLVYLVPQQVQQQLLSPNGSVTYPAYSQPQQNNYSQPPINIESEKSSSNQLSLNNVVETTGKVANATEKVANATDKISSMF